MPFDSSGEPRHLAPPPVEPPLDARSDFWALVEPEVPAIAVVLAAAAAAAAVAVLYLLG